MQAWKDIMVTLAGLALVGCGGSYVGTDPGGADSNDPLTTVNKGQGAWTVFDNPFGDGTANPAAQLRAGGVLEMRFLRAKTTTVTLALSGLTANMMFAAHAHKLACDDNKGGGHYQNVVAPAGTDPKDPMYVNAENEMHFTFITDAGGGGMARAYVKWLARDTEAKSIVIHDMDDDGMGNPVPGAKIACMDIGL
jgi:hypothetical protein